MMLPYPGTHIADVPPPISPPISQPLNCTTAVQAATLSVQSSAAGAPAPLRHLPPPAPGALMTPRGPTGSLVFASPQAPVPRPLASFLHHKALCLDALDPHAYPHFPDPSFADPLEARTLYGTYGAPSVTGELRLRHLVEDFRASEAAKCGCRVSDIAWYCQASHVPVSGMHSWGQSCIKSSECLSHSSTFSSGPCTASFVVLYLNSCIENSLVLQALEFNEDAAPGMVHFSFSCLCA